MSASTRTPALTFDDFCLLVKGGQKADLINGVIYMASPDNTDANKLFIWLLRLLGDFVEEKGLGEVYGSRVAFRLGEGDGPEPDIAYVRKERLHLVRRGYVDGPPDLAIEIVSPESVERDYEDKRTQYQQAGVAEYWIIDEMEQKVTLLRLGRGRRYREVRPRSGELHSQAVPGFWLRPEWLWQDPRPRKTEVLNQLLAREDHP
jgi:Uma2 family endonuclease